MNLHAERVFQCQRMLPPRFVPPCTMRSCPTRRCRPCRRAENLDEPPRAPAFPYVTLARRALPISPPETNAAEHQLTLHAWSRQGGHREAHVITGALMQALDDAPLALADHHLVNFRFAVADVRRESDGRTYHALVHFPRADRSRDASSSHDEDRRLRGSASNQKSPRGITARGQTLGCSVN